MVPDDLGKELQESIKKVFHWGSRYHAEKIGVIAGFVVLSVASALWAFSEPTDDDELGTELEFSDGMTGFELIVENTGDSDWRDVRITLDRQHLYTTDRIEAGDYVRLNNENLRYAYYVPRSWAAAGWDELVGEEQPSSHPAEDYEPSFVQIRAREGQVDVEL